MPINWIIFVPVLLMFFAPFLFKIKSYENVEIIKKRADKSGIFTGYTLIIEDQNNRFTLPVTREVYNQLNVGSIVTLYYNTGDEKVTNYNY